jgi:hypothetical protein
MTLSRELHDRFNEATDRLGTALRHQADRRGRDRATESEIRKAEAEWNAAFDALHNTAKPLKN